MNQQWHLLDRVATTASRVGGLVAACGTRIPDRVDESDRVDFEPRESSRCPACQGTFSSDPMADAMADPGVSDAG